MPEEAFISSVNTFYQQCSDNVMQLAECNYKLLYGIVMHAQFYIYMF